MAKAPDFKYLKTHLVYSFFSFPRRTLNYGQPALTDAANKVNAQ
jgi:hypothetical protein|tara:strand:- start:5408 stop:5539 length:132 start_codon:yes stop_codon:yes gene_type:complete